MGRNIEDIIAGLPKARQGRIDEKAKKMAREMIAHADSLGEIRKAIRKTQSEMGKELGLPQNAVSQLEKRSDLLLSTLRRYVGALGGEVEIIVRLKDGSQVVLEGFGTEKLSRISPRRKSAVRATDKRN